MKQLKKQIAILALIVMGVALTACNEETGNNPAPSDTNEEILTIGILQSVDHPAFDDALQGFMDAVEGQGFTVEWDIQNAQGDASTLATISQRFVNNDVDLVLALGTPAVQSIATETTEIPILGTAITSYEAAGVVNSHAEPGSNVSGTSNLNPIDQQVDLIFEILGELPTIGLLYTSGAANSEMQVDIAREHLISLGVEIDELTITNVNDLQQVATTLANRVDAIWVPTDNIVASALPLVQQISLETGTPFFPAETNMIIGSGIATLSVNHYDLGYQTGEMAGRLFRGEAEIATLAVEYSNSFSYIVNGSLAAQLGITIPARLEAYVVYPENE